MSAFELSKWYADCIDSCGNASILYHATLRIGGVPIRYENFLSKRGHDAPVAEYSVLPGPEPTLEDGALKWSSPNLKISGHWRSSLKPYRETLCEVEGKTVDWNCFAPRATAFVTGPDGSQLDGLGYAEHIHLSIPPWRLPIRTLRWGRFISEEISLTWVDWIGSSSKRRVLLNGTPVDADWIDDDSINLGRFGSLAFHEKQIIREGRLGSTALAVIPGFKKIFPDSVLNLSETKWLSQAIFQREGASDIRGMAIHEVVQWP